MFLAVFTENKCNFALQSKRRLTQKSIILSSPDSKETLASGELLRIKNIIMIKMIV